MDTNNYLNQVLPAFDSLNRELSLGFCLVDTFPDHFFFYIVNHKSAEARIVHQNKLKNIYMKSFNSHDTMLIITNASVKNNITTTILHIQRKHRIIMKTVHHTINIMFTKAKIFAIRCGISQVSQMQDVTCIVIITDTIPAAKRIFDTSLYLYQLHSITISSNLRKFFNKNSSNSISFWDCPSNDK